MILSMNVFFNNTILHSSLKPITSNTFPLNYSIALTDRDFQLENATNFFVVCVIWQPAYMYEDGVTLPESQVDTLNLDVRAISKYIFFLFKLIIFYSKNLLSFVVALFMINIVQGMRYLQHKLN
jgi:hypothetical protein